ncbi:MAG TPA: peptide-methionine (S)-S-oxide reductase MsrA [Caulobacteraceae bacterium]|jgi:peptide-methionine (S)-S-oxide reductase
MSMRPHALKTPLAAAAASVGLATAILTTGAALGAGWGPDRPVLAPSPAYSPPSPAREETAVLAGGCFWGLQGVFDHVQGVKQVLAGYAGGKKSTADYETVSTGTTGHAESVKIVFDPQQISFGDILRIYFSVATDPTQLNRQFPDDGPQYRGEIFYVTPEQKEIATRYIAQLQSVHLYARPIVTMVEPFSGFYRAEDYHQDYLLKHPDAPYIATFDLPKVRSLKVLFPQRYRAVPVRS